MSEDEPRLDGATTERRRYRPGRRHPGRRRELTRTLVAGGLVAGLAAFAGTLAAPPDVWASAATGQAADGPHGDPSDPAQDGGPDEGNEGRGGRPVGCDPGALIEALMSANANQGGSLSLARGCTYTLTAGSGGNGLPVITQRITILGNGARIVRAAGADHFRFFDVAASGDLTLKNLTLFGGYADANGGAVAVELAGRATLNHTKLEANRSSMFGGAAVNEGNLTVVDSTLDRNLANIGGAIASATSVTVDGTTIEGNHVSDSAGGVYIADGAATIRYTTFRSNNAPRNGGGLFANADSLTVDRSTFTRNTAGLDGGGIDNADNLTLRDSEVADNTANRNGGGIANIGGAASLVADDVKFADNAAGANGGGLYNDGGARAVLRDSEVEDNRTATGTGAGIDNTDGSLSLVDGRVTGNDAATAPGGVFSGTNGVTVDNRSVIVGNRPTNCAGSPVTVPNCFG